MDLKSLLTVNNIVAAILIIVGLVWLIQSVWRNMKIRNINSWSKTNATVISAMAEPVNEAAGNTYVDPQNIVATTDSEARYKPQVTYRYRVNGRDYESTNIIYNDDREYSPAQIKTLMAPMRPGATIPIYYNPREFNEAYIYNSETSWVGPVIGTILTLLGLWLAFKGFKKYKKAEYIEAKTKSKNKSGFNDMKSDDFNTTDHSRDYNTNGTGYGRTYDVVYDGAIARGLSPAAAANLATKAAANAAASGPYLATGGMPRIY
ncbi:Domain of unknown function (DUF3592)-containing protein [uncultured virus]|nr:Domain of unknown function (DUF3592)-containing protein [uncultured virus]